MSKIPTEERLDNLEKALLIHDRQIKGLDKKISIVDIEEALEQQKKLTDDVLQKMDNSKCIIVSFNEMFSIIKVAADTTSIEISGTQLGSFQTTKASVVNQLLNKLIDHRVFSFTEKEIILLHHSIVK